jgi:hypothetical protein
MDYINYVKIFLPIKQIYIIFTNTLFLRFLNGIMYNKRLQVHLCSSSRYLVATVLECLFNSSPSAEDFFLLILYASIDRDIALLFCSIHL